MAKQTIDIGSAANDGTGDDLRTGATKINDNFTELYSDVAALQAATGTSITGIGFDSGRIVFEGATNDTNETTFQAADPTKDNTITLPDSSGTVALITDIKKEIDSAYISLLTGTAFDSNSTKVLIDENALDSGRATRLIDSAYVKARMRMDSFDGDFIPGLDSTYDLGSSSRKWKDLHLSGSTIHLGNSTITNDGSNIAFGVPIQAEIQVQNSMDLNGNKIQDLGAGGLELRANSGFIFATGDGVDLMTVDRNGNMYMGDSDSASVDLVNFHVARTTDANINNANREKGNISYSTTDNKFKLRDNTGVFSLPRDVIGDADLQATVDSAYVQARAVELDLRDYTVATVPTGTPGKMIFVTDGNSGLPCLAVFDSANGNYLRVALGSPIST